MKRIILFLLTNLSVMLFFAVILSFTPIHSKNLYNLILFSGIFGFSGAIVSLLMSKWIALSLVGGRIIKYPKNDIENWLINKLFYLSKKVKITTPELAIYESIEINAFATGYRKNSSLVAVSTGLLKSMNFKEIEAVLAHEISHIKSGDMVTMTLIQGVINTFIFFISRIIAGFFLNNSYKKENNSEGENQHPILYFLLTNVLEILFSILASIIVFSFSRYREFRADAGSANIVGKENMISALKSMKNSQILNTSDCISTSYINGKSNNFSFLFQSHPPLEIRIKALSQEKYM
ncbi:Protease HtpX [Buchnera aphidicola (Tetraneura ulmi)]|uniref:protease HtpX n=1 Tax=Buchnera aphidicola TaxID=9 RepID=UPI0034643CEB